MFFGGACRVRGKWNGSWCLGRTLMKLVCQRIEVWEGEELEA